MTDTTSPKTGLIPALPGGALEKGRALLAELEAKYGPVPLRPLTPEEQDRLETELHYLHQQRTIRSR